jgi:hypothetical protein
VKQCKGKERHARKAIAPLPSRRCIETSDAHFAQIKTQPSGRLGSCYLYLCKEHMLYGGQHCCLVLVRSLVRFCTFRPSAAFMSADKCSWSDHKGFVVDKETLP